MSTATIELSSTRRALFDVLGDNQQQYLDYIKNWFRKRCTKEEFDSAARKLLTPESVHLHNQFLLAVLNKCQTLVNISPCPPLAKLETQSSNIPELLSPSKFDVPDRLKKGKIKRKSKPNRASLEHRFQPVSVPQCAPEVTLPASLAPEESSLQLCAREQLLPDIGLVHGRLLVAAWEEGLEGVEESAVQLALAAAEQQLRKLVVCLLKTRNSWEEGSGVLHSLGSTAPDPWLLNTQSRRKCEGLQGGAVAANVLNDQCLAPSHREEVDRAEAEAMYSLALARPSPRPSRPLGLYDLLAALQGDKDVIPSHSVYSINMERIILKLHHEQP